MWGLGLSIPIKENNNSAYVVSCIHSHILYIMHRTHHVNLDSARETQRFRILREKRAVSLVCRITSFNLESSMLGRNWTQHCLGQGNLPQTVSHTGWRLGSPRWHIGAAVEDCKALLQLDHSPGIDVRHNPPSQHPTPLWDQQRWYNIQHSYHLKT